MGFIIISMDEALQVALDGLPLPALRVFDEVGSTNDVALTWLAEGGPDGALVIANSQTRGRGRMGRTWVTVPGAGLAFTLLLRPSSEEGACGGRFAALGALAVASGLEEGFGLRPEIKWPNDVLLGGRKVCGILVESAWEGERLQGIALGIGINVLRAALPPPEVLHYPATSLEDHLDYLPDRWQVLRHVLIAFQTWRARLAQEEFLKAWQQRLAFRGRLVLADDGHNPPILGVVWGLSPEGHLVLKTHDGQKVCLTAGEIHPWQEESRSHTSGGEDA